MPDNSANNKRIAKNSIFLSIRMVIVLVLTLYTTRVVLRILGVEDYGIYNVVAGFVSMFAFLNTSMSNGIQRFFNYEFGKGNHEEAKNVYNTSLIIQLFLAITIVLLAETAGMWYIYNKMVIAPERFHAALWIFQFSILSLVIVVLQAPYTADVIAHEKMDFFAVMSIVDTVLKLIMVLLVPLFSYDRLVIYGFLYTLVSLFVFISYFIYCKKYFEEITEDLKFNKTLFKSMLVFSGWNLWGSFSSVVRSQGINLILNFFFGPIVNAARGIAVQINGGIQSFVQNLTIPVRPQVMQSFASGDLNRSMRLTYSISKLSCYFLTMISIPICMEIETILKIWLSNNIPNHTALFSIIVIMCSYQGNLNSAISCVVHASGKMKNYQFWSSLVKMSSVPMAYFILSLGYEPEAALICVLIFDLLGHVVGLFILRTIIPFSILDYLKKVVNPILIVLVSSLILLTPIHYFITDKFLRLVVMCISSIVLVGFFSYIFGLDKNEKFLLRNLIGTINSKIKGA